MLIHEQTAIYGYTATYFVLALTLRPRTSTPGTPKPETSFPGSVSPFSTKVDFTLLTDPPDASVFSLLFELVKPLNIPPIRFCQLVFLAP